MSKLVDWFLTTNRGRLVASLIWPCLPTLLVMFMTPSNQWSWSKAAFFLGVNYSTLTIFILAITKGRFWTPFAGYYMTANLERIKEMSVDRQIDTQAEIYDWSKSMAGYFRFQKVNEYRYQFLRKKDAMAFKLTWG